MGKEQCVSCQKELGFMKYKPKKEWGLPEGNLCGDCLKVAEKHKVSIPTGGINELSPGQIDNLKKQFAEATQLIDSDKPITKEMKDQASAQRRVRDAYLKARTEDYKLLWEKNGIIQFKNERVAILKRQWGAQVEFIVAFDDVTREGYELKAIDEGKTQEGTLGQSGGVSSYYYFQKLNGIGTV